MQKISSFHHKKQKEVLFIEKKKKKLFFFLQKKIRNPNPNLTLNPIHQKNAKKMFLSPQKAKKGMFLSLKNQQKTDPFT